MLRHFAEPAIHKAEKDLGAPFDHLRRMADVTPGAFVKFGLFAPLSRHRKALPSAPYHIARIAVTRMEDCGTCLQIEANLALQDGVPAPLVRAAVDGNDKALPEDIQEVVRFARAVASADDSTSEALRGELEARYGEAGMIELGLGLASCRFFPTMKRAMGYATACSLVTVEVPDG